MKYCFKGILYIILVMTICSCKKPYNPPAIAASASYLVVAGVINAGPDSTIINLSRTVNLSSKVTVNPELNATVVIQSDQNAVYPLYETSNGNYVAAGLNLDNAHNYRLSIRTSNNGQYYSDYVPVLNSPPIDSLYFTATSTGVNIYSATHDPSNKIKYYRWDYQETWIIHPPFDSGFISNGDTVLIRTPAQQVYKCWQTETSSTIVLGSSAKLARDVIVDNPVTALPGLSPKIANEYSIIVRQYALTADAYSFWINLKKNTEQLGSIFDAQPSQISGNIHSATNPSEPVIGYVSIGSTASQRIFITTQQLPAYGPPNEDYPPNCEAVSYLYNYYAPGSTIPVNQVDEYINYDKGGSTAPLIPIAPIAQPGGPILGFTAAPAICVDCTLRGTNIQPAYWKY